MGAMARVLEAWRSEEPAAALRVLDDGIRWRIRRLLGRRATTAAMVTSHPSTPKRTARRMTADRSIAAATARLLEFDEPARSTEKAPAPIQSDVAIIVPCFNHSRFLPDALESVRRQTHEQWRCLVIDDASDDPVWPIVESFSRDDPRFVYVRHGRNAGLAAARNTGLRLAHETFVQFLDADDMLTPNSLRERVRLLHAHADDPVVAGSHGQVLQCPEETTVDDVATWRGWVDRPRIDWIESDGECPFPINGALVRTALVKAVGGFDESLVDGAEDWELWHRILRHGFAFVPWMGVAGAYRQHEASMIRAHADAHLRRAGALIDLGSSWVLVDPKIAVGPATMPLADARHALRRVTRAAWWAGIRAAFSSRPEDAVDEVIQAFVRDQPMVGTRHQEIVTMVRRGLLRGLGLSPNVVGKLPEEARSRLQAAAMLITDRILAATDRLSAPPEGSHPVDLVRRSDPDVVLVADSAADVAVLAGTGRELAGAGLTVAAVDIDYVKGDEGATEAWRRAGVPLLPYNAVILGQSRPRVAVARRPAGPVVVDLLASVEAGGGSARFAAGVGRDYELAEAPSAGAQFAEETTEGLAALARQDPGRRGDRRPWKGSALPLRLSREESDLDRDNKQKLARLRDLHRGQTAIIIGNGPSLNQTDLALLDRAPTFGVNAIFLAADRLPKPITYYVVEDTKVFAENSAAIKEFKVGTRLFPEIYRRHFADDEVDESTIFFRMNQGFYGRRTGNLCHPRFSVDATQRLFCGQSVTTINLQLAYWMGFQRVVLIGMDFSYQIPDDAVRRGHLITSMSDDPNHFHPSYFGAGKTWKDPKLDRVLANYALAKEMFEADGREIVNATVGGALELFDRMDLADAV
jgi:glycosyltransferase involved in cell wall biosynthesis